MMTANGFLRHRDTAPRNEVPEPDFPTLAVDAWVASSLLQKAIRRGEIDIAQQAAMRLYQLRGAAIWRRLMVIAFEDIGAGNMDAVASVVSLAADARARAAAGTEQQVLLELVRRMAESPKDRATDYLVSVIQLHPDLEEVRERIGGLKIPQRLDLVSDLRLPLATRAAAAWFASGVNVRGENRLGPGDLPALMSVYRNLDVPEPLVAASHLGVLRAREPICILLPLLWLAAFENEVPKVESCPLPASPRVRGVPMYAFDCHTQIGKAAVRQIARENANVRTCLEVYVPDYRSHRAACLGVFFTDASPVANRFDWPGSTALETLGIAADFLGANVPREGIAPIRRVFHDNIDHLNAIRARLFSGRRP